jgi:hypothetical protein
LFKLVQLIQPIPQFWQVPFTGIYWLGQTLTHCPLNKWYPVIHVLHCVFEEQVEHDVGHLLQSVLFVMKVLVGHWGRHWWVAILW